MQNWRQIAHEAKDMLTVCLAKSIDRALSAQNGINWFADFALAESKEKVNTRIVKPGHQSVQDMDLQALLKFLRYRTSLTNQVLSYYGFFEGLDDFAAEGQLRQLSALLDRLINDFRNRIEAHNRAVDIEKELSGHGLERVYGYEEAYQDMLKLARIFRSVTDSSGTSYARHIESLKAEKKEEKKKTKRLPILLGAVAVLSLVIGLYFWLKPDTPHYVYRSSLAPTVKTGEISVQPAKVYYDGDELVAVCYVVNGLQERVSQVSVDQLILHDGERIIAAADFGTLEGLTIAPGGSVTHKFRFPKEAVQLHDSKLPQLKAQYSCRLP